MPKARSILSPLKWLCIILSELVGLAGIPDDLAKWETVMTPILEYIDQSWAIRASLVLSGIMVATVSLWWPRVRAIFRPVDEWEVIEYRAEKLSPEEIAHNREMRQLAPIGIPQPEFRKVPYMLRNKRTGDVKRVPAD